jgi:hypothetical protein
MMALRGKEKDALIYVQGIELLERDSTGYQMGILVPMQLPNARMGTPAQQSSRSSMQSANMLVSRVLQTLVSACIVLG